MSRRTEKLNAEFQRAIQQVITRGLQDPRARGLITVTKVEVAKDLRDASVHVSVLPHEHEDLTLHALKDAAKHIRRQAGELVAMNRLPAFHFKLDSSLKKQAGVIRAIAMQSRADTARNPAPPDTAQDDTQGTTP